MTTKTKADFSELPARIVSALILAAITFWCIWAGGIWFQLLVTLATAIIFSEYANIVARAMPLRVNFFAFAFLILLIISGFYGALLPGVLITIAGIGLLAVWEWIIRRSVWSALGLAYSAIFFVAILALRDGAPGILVILFVAACVWGADIFAYFFGKLIGGPKLAPAISPGKTWAGFVGGFVGAFTLSLALLLYWQGGFGVSAVILAASLCLASQLGDLFESGLKRKFNVKDSGKIIPGHGGLLDRVDGLVFAAGLALVIAIVTMGISPEQNFSLRAVAETLHNTYLSSS